MLLALLATVVFMYRNSMRKDVWISSLLLDNSLAKKKQKALEVHIGEITDTINSVESKLQDVRSKQVRITGMIFQYEKGDAQKTRMLQDISVIEDQLKQDKQEISDLQDQIKRSSVRFKLLDEVIADLRMEIEINEKSMAELRKMIEEKDRVIEVKDQVIVEKDRVIKSKADSLDFANENLRMVVGELEQTNELLDETKNTAYYVVGRKKDLLEKKVLRESGGFLRRRLNISGNFDKTAFTKVHIARESEFPVNCRAKDVQIMPVRDADTFTLEPIDKKACVLTVTNPEQFWKIPFLVILVKD